MWFLILFITIRVHCMDVCTDVTSNWLPNWLAPNLITLTGLITLILSYLITAYYNIDFMHETPRWNYLLAAVAVFVYLHMDCLDGKQARKTGTSSPLGQLFDHGMFRNIQPTGSMGSKFTGGLVLCRMRCTCCALDFDKYHNNSSDGT